MQQTSPLRNTCFTFQKHNASETGSRAAFYAYILESKDESYDGGWHTFLSLCPIERQQKYQRNDKVRESAVVEACLVRPLYPLRTCFRLFSTRASTNLLIASSKALISLSHTSIEAHSLGERKTIVEKNKGVPSTVCIETVKRTTKNVSQLREKWWYLSLWVYGSRRTRRAEALIWSKPRPGYNNDVPSSYLTFHIACVISRILWHRLSLVTHRVLFSNEVIEIPPHWKHWSMMIHCEGKSSLYFYSHRL